MFEAIQQRASWPVLRNATLILLLATIAAITPMFVGPMIAILDKAAISSSGKYAVGVLVLVAISMPVWFLLLLREKYVYALGLQILLLPFTFRISSGLGIPAYDDGNFVQRLSLTTFFILGFLLWLLLSRVKIHVRPELKIFEKLLLAFAVLTTISQLANHFFLNALLLAIGGAWQFVALFYILCFAVRDSEQAKFLLKCIVIALVLGIIDRMLSQGQAFLVEAPSSMAKLSPHAVAGDYVRVGGGAFGFAQSYGGYLSFVSIMAFYLVQSAKNRLFQTFWMIAILVLVFEMINTFTRGATLALLFVFLLLFWKSTRTFFTKILIASAIVMTTWVGSFVLNLATVRNLELTPTFILNDPNSVGRFDVWVQSLPHFFDNWGLGYGIGKPLLFYIQGYGEAVSHNVTLDLSQSVGGLATVLFLIIFGLSVQRLFQTSRDPKKPTSRLAIYLLIGLLAWFFFANTTSTSLVYYYPYEATIVFYSVMFLGVLLSVMPDSGRSQSPTVQRKKI